MIALLKLVSNIYFLGCFEIALSTRMCRDRISRNAGADVVAVCRCADIVL